MPRYIDADALGIGYANPKVFNCEEYARGWNSAIEIINSAPTVSPDELRGVGKWIPKTDIGDCIYACSKCGFVRDAYVLNIENYCPQCGAKMGVSEDA
jgi:hypothetical protein